MQYFTMALASLVLLASALLLGALLLTFLYGVGMSVWQLYRALRGLPR